MTRQALSHVLAVAPRLPFVVLLRWLERLLDAPAAVGALGPWHSEGVRFRHDASLGFHAADIVEATLVEPHDAPAFVQLTTSFVGLTGAVSPLPPALIEPLCRDDNDENAVQREFFDLFHHRLLGLLYRGLLKCDLARGSDHEGRGRTLDWVLQMAGLAPAHAERLTGLPRARLLALAPLLVTYPGNAERIAVALRFVLDDVLGGAPLRILQLRGRLTEIDPSARTRLGVDLRLGQTSTLGLRAPAPSSEIALDIGPLPPEACARLCPRGDRFGELSAIVGLFCPETIRVAVELMPTLAPPARLGVAGAQLGRDAWLHGRGPAHPIRFALERHGTRGDQHAP